MKIQRQAQRSLLTGENPDELAGMTHNRLRYLNQILPEGWEDGSVGDKAFLDIVQSLFAWYTRHGKTWPKSLAQTT